MRKKIAPRENKNIWGVTYKHPSKHANFIELSINRSSLFVNTFPFFIRTTNYFFLWLQTTDEGSKKNTSASFVFCILSIGLLSRFMHLLEFVRLIQTIYLSKSLHFTNYRSKRQIPFDLCQPWVKKSSYKKIVCHKSIKFVAICTALSEWRWARAHFTVVNKWCIKYTVLPIDENIGNIFFLLLLMDLIKFRGEICFSFEHT